MGKPGNISFLESNLSVIKTPMIVVMITITDAIIPPRRKPEAGSRE